MPITKPQSAAESIFGGGVGPAGYILTSAQV